MRVRKALPVIPFVLGTFICAAAQGQTEPSATKFTVGVKAWHADWQSYIPSNYSGIGANGAPALGDSVNVAEGTSHTDLFPLLAVRHGKLFASISHARFSSDFRAQTSPIVLPTGQTVITSRNDHFKRRESDLNFAWFVTPELAIALGYKDATETRDTTLGIAPQGMPLSKTRARGVLLGVLGSFAVVDKLRLYAQAGYGPARVTVSFADPASADVRSSGRYFIGEIGLSYPIFSRPDGSMSATTTLGYRTQTIKTGISGGIFQESHDLRDIRDGVILSLNVTL